MFQHSTNKVVRERREPIPVARVVERIMRVWSRRIAAPAWIAVRSGCPCGKMAMGAVAGLVGQWLRGERCPQAMPPRHSARRLAVPDLTIRSRQCRPVTDRHLLLAMAELRVVELDGHALGFDRANEIDREVMGQREPRGREAEAFVDRHEAVTLRTGLAPREEEFRFERC